MITAKEYEIIQPLIDDVGGRIEVHRKGLIQTITLQVQKELGDCCMSGTIQTFQLIKGLETKALLTEITMEGDVIWYMITALGIDVADDYRKRYTN